VLRNRAALGLLMRVMSLGLLSRLERLARATR